MMGSGAPWALDSSNGIAAAWGSRTTAAFLQHVWALSSHTALSFHKYCFQTKKPCLLAAWLPPATVLLGEKGGCPLCGKLVSEHALALWAGCPAFASPSRSLNRGKVPWEEWVVWINGSWQGYLQEYTITYDGKPTGPMLWLPHLHWWARYLGTERVCEALSPSTVQNSY